MGRHYTEPSDVIDGLVNIMRSAHPEPIKVMGPLMPDTAQTHADSLNQNDEDDIRKYGEVQN